MNILIPLAGSGNRFVERNILTPKPLIDVNGKPMIQKAVESLKIAGHYIFVIQGEHNVDNVLYNKLKEIEPTCDIIELDDVTDGSTQTCLAAKDIIDNDSPLVIVNCDQIFDWDSKRFLNYVNNTDMDGCVLTYYSSDSKNSFVKLDDKGNATLLAEKMVISNKALTGLHYWKKGNDFVWSAEQLIQKDIRMKNEYYISITYNLLIEQGKIIKSFDLEEGEHYHCVGTPTDLYKYLDEQCGVGVEITKMTDMFRGWYVGDFEPTVYKTDAFEAGFLLHKKGEKWPSHYHKDLTEINYMVEGQALINNKIINAGDIFVFKRGVPCSPVFLEDCKIMCIKTPGILGDKHCF
jgi:dTDP-glucose pyrophosphorylase